MYSHASQEKNIELTAHAQRLPLIGRKESLNRSVGTGKGERVITCLEYAAQYWRV